MPRRDRHSLPDCADRSPLSLIWPLFVSVRVRRLPPRDCDVRRKTSS